MAKSSGGMTSLNWHPPSDGGWLASARPASDADPADPPAPPEDPPVPDVAAPALPPVPVAAALDPPALAAELVFELLVPPDPVAVDAAPPSPIAPPWPAPSTSPEQPMASPMATSNAHPHPTTPFVDRIECTRLDLCSAGRISWRFY